MYHYSRGRNASYNRSKEESNQFKEMKKYVQNLEMGIGDKEVLEKYIQGVIINGYHSDVNVFRSCCVFASTVGIRYLYDFDYPALAGIDERNNFYIAINPIVTMKSVSREMQILFLLAHEVKHIIYRHSIKYRNFFEDEVNQVLMNISADAEVNTILEKEMAAEGYRDWDDDCDYKPDIGCVNLYTIYDIVKDIDSEFREFYYVSKRWSSYNSFGKIGNGDTDVRSIADRCYVALNNCCKILLGKDINRLIYDCKISKLNFKEEIWKYANYGESDLFDVRPEHVNSAMYFCGELLSYLRFSPTVFIVIKPDSTENGDSEEDSKGASSESDDSEGDYSENGDLEEDSEGDYSENDDLEEGLEGDPSESSNSEGDSEGCSSENWGLWGTDDDNLDDDDETSSENSSENESTEEGGEEGDEEEEGEPQENKYTGFKGDSESEYSRYKENDKRIKDAFEERNTRKTIESKDSPNWYEVEDNLNSVEKAWTETCITFGIRGKGEGSLEGTSLVKYFKSESQVPWQAILKNRLNSISREYEGTKKRINRRQPDRLELSGRRRKRSVSLIIGIDESGSISDKEYSYFIEEIFKIVSQFDCCLHIYEFTGKIESYTYVSDDKIKAFKKTKKEFASKRFGGGTNFQPVFDAIEENNKIDKESLLIMFTDGYGESFVDYKKQEDRLWVVVGGGYLSCVEKKKNIYPVVRIK